MKTVMSKIGFTGSIREFAAHVKNNKDLYPKTAEELLDSYRNILIQMDKKVPEFFGRLPKAQYGIKAIEKYREQAAPAAYYYPPPVDFSRPGYFYANTYQPEKRPKYEMEALSYHEAVPGHHLQIAIMQEMENLPDFRKHEGSTAFIEGWALYAEKLSKEMGFYQDDYSEYGRLTFEIWRAVRLVVDTGLHFYKWSRSEAINYCKENSGLEDHEIAVEVDRYIAMPGQALAYKIGELKILELREKLKEALGQEFDIKKFHDRLLENGALPLYLLEDVMNA
jgi:prolyl oligopeptidase